MPQIRDYLRNYFTSKTADDLTPDKEAIIKDDLKENLNRILSKPTIKEILFDELERGQDVGGRDWMEAHD